MHKMIAENAGHPIIGRLNHVGIATPSIEAGLEIYVNLLGGIPEGPARDLPDFGVRVCFIDVHNSQIELVAPLGDNSPVSGFLERSPRGGPHHICFETPDLEQAIAVMTARGTHILGKPRIGSHGVPVIFAHPKDMGGTLIELMEVAPQGA